MCVHTRDQLCLFFVTSWTVAPQAPLSMEFSGQEDWSGLPFPSPRNRTCVSCIGRQILYHRATWEAQGTLKAHHCLKGGTSLLPSAHALPVTVASLMIIQICSASPQHKSWKWDVLSPWISQYSWGRGCYADTSSSQGSLTRLPREPTPTQKASPARLCWAIIPAPSGTYICPGGLCTEGCRLLIINLTPMPLGGQESVWQLCPWCLTPLALMESSYPGGIS